MFLDGNEHKRTIYVALEPTNAGCHMHQQQFFQMSGFFTIVKISKHSQNCYSTLGVNRLICLLTPFFGACRK